MGESRVRFSVVVPVLNEAGIIEECLQRLQSWRPVLEVIVVDGGSADGTASLARPLCDTLLCSEPGRARQMNAGARSASGQYLFFLHSDTRIESSPADVQAALSLAPAWGYFSVQLSGALWSLRVIEWFMNVRSRATRVATGDQLLFVRRDVWQSLGGFAEIPLMEDVELCKRLRRVADPIRPAGGVCTSSRRWEEQGVWRTVLAMWRLRMAYLLGASPYHLAKIYREG
jgi:rSAM/selenodomain-associated transferase 2